MKKLTTIFLILLPLFLLAGNPDSTGVGLRFKTVRGYVPWTTDVRSLSTITLNATQDYLAVFDSSELKWKQIKVSSFLTPTNFPPLYYSDNNFSTTTPSSPAATTGSYGVDRRKGNIYTGTAFGTKVTQENGNNSTVVLSDVTSPFVFDSNTGNRAYFTNSATANDSVAAVTNLSGQDPGELFVVCIENTTGSSDTIVDWHSDFLNTDLNAITKDIVLSTGSQRCFQFRVTTIGGSNKLVYEGDYAELSSSATGSIYTTDGTTVSDLDVTIGDSITLGNILRLSSNGGLSIGNTVPVANDFSVRRDDIVLQADDDITIDAGASGGLAIINSNGSAVINTPGIDLIGLTGGSQPTMTFNEDNDLGTDAIILQAPNSLSGNFTQTFTAATGEIPVILKGSATLDFGSVAAGTCEELTITVTGAVDGDVTMVGVPNGSTPTTGQFTAWVSAADTVTVMFCNNALVTAADPASGTFKVQVSK